MEPREEEQLAQQQQACAAARSGAAGTQVRGSGKGWRLWGWGSPQSPANTAEAGVEVDKDESDADADSEAGDNEHDSIADEAEPALARASGRWQWLRNLTSQTVGAGAGLLQLVGERQYQRLCIDKFHLDRVQVNRAQEALDISHGKLPWRPLGVTPYASQDMHRAELAEDEVCARAVELVYGDNDAMIEAMQAEFAEQVLMPDCPVARDETVGERSVDPKWVVVRLKQGVLRGGRTSEGALVVFRGTHSWEDTMHDFLCIPTEHASGLMVHRGVALALKRTEFAILQALTKALHGLKNPRIILTGHSYGGALALVLQLHSLVDAKWEHVSNIPGRMSTVTFGAPLVFAAPTSDLARVCLFLPPPHLLPLPSVLAAAFAPTSASASVSVSISTSTSAFACACVLCLCLSLSWWHCRCGSVCLET